MRNWPQAAASWVRGLFTTAANKQVRTANADAERTSTTGALAVMATEGYLCDSLVHVGNSSGAASAASVHNLFDTPVNDQFCTSTRAALATAAGLAATGQRVAAFVSTTSLDGLQAQLHTIVDRRLPLVVHAADETHAREGQAVSPHAACHRLAQTGMVVGCARDAQEAVDMTMLARRVAETTLTPVLVCMDGADTAHSSTEIALPAQDFVREFTGAPTDTIETPTPAQICLFGDHRRRLPAWFDSKRVVLHGADRHGSYASAAAAAQRLMFTDHVHPALTEAVAAFQEASGRDLSPLRLHRVTDANCVVVCMGAISRQAERLADELAADDVADFGVITLRWLVAQNREPLRKALQNASRILVLQRGSGAHSRPLTQLVRGAAVADAKITTATYGAGAQAINAATLGAAIDGLSADSASVDTLDLDLPCFATSSRFPKREVALQSLNRAYPQLRSLAVSTGSSEDAETPAVATHAPQLYPADHISTGYNSLPRFWGEFLQAQTEAHEPVVPEPGLALGLVPPASTRLFDASAARTTLPKIDHAACIGCGECWTQCPHSAFTATAIPTQELLDAAASAAEPVASEHKAAATKLKRAHKQLATRIDGALAKDAQASLTASILNDSFEWLLSKLKPTDDEEAAMRAAFANTADALVPVATTSILFREPHGAAKGSGQQLALAIDPSTCRACGICTAACPTDAIAPLPTTPASLAADRKQWKNAMALPDTRGDTIAAAAQHEGLGDLSAILLSRHCALALSGHDTAEPGSGQRLALRQVVAVTEYVMQRRLAGRQPQLETLIAELRKTVEATLTAALPTENLGLLDEVLSGARTSTGVAELAQRMAEIGEGRTIDAGRLRCVVELTRELEQLEGDAYGGVGSASFGLVLVGESLRAWAATFPRNPFAVPVTTALASDAPELARGLALGVLARELGTARLLRAAALAIEAPSDLVEKQNTLQHLTTEELTADELSLCPPVLLACTTSSLDQESLAGLAVVLASRLPIKVVLLDEHDLEAGRIDPCMFALAHKAAAVVSASLAHRQHFFASVSQALAYQGPALIHIHAPSPARHGFDSAQTVERARAAVEARVHPLMSYNPDVAGVFGTRLTLTDNSDRTALWALGEDDQPYTPAHWAQGESRFDTMLSAKADAATAERASHWRTLQELAGEVTPFTDHVEQRIVADVEAAHASELAELRAKHASELAALEADQRSAQATQLRERLLQMAGFKAGTPGQSTPL